MEFRYTVHITPAEWRWVTYAAVGLILLVFLPLVWVALLGTNQWQFMGALHNYLDGASYISKMNQGAGGSLMVRFWHTPEAHTGAFIQVLYPLLGQVSRLTQVPTIVLFHVARAGAALFMYIALYQLAACIWQRVRTRRIFFALAAFGAGFGWLLAPLTGTSDFPDLTVPEIFPFMGTLYNIHFPLTVALLALTMSLLLLVFRPGAERHPELDNSAISVGGLSLLLAFLYPQALVPLGVALGVYTLSVWVAQRRVTARPLRWLFAVALPAAPLAVYYAAVVTDIPAFAAWNAQNITPSPSPLILLGGLGLPLILALPTLTRAVRRWEYDDRLMLFWLAAMLILMYLPTGIQRRFAVGMMIPIAYFATRAIEDVWLRRINRRYRSLTFGIVFPLLAASPLLTLFLPVLPALAGNPGAAAGVFLQRDYARVFQWINARTSPDDVVLAAPVVSAWLPGWAVTRSVYGHPYETLDATGKRLAVEAWYAAPADACPPLITTYGVRYVIVGPQEHALGSAACAGTMQRVLTYGQVNVYAP